MSGKPDDDRHEGWEGLAEETAEGSLQPSQELEEALREAEEAVEERQASRRRGAAEAAAPAAQAELDAARQELEATKERMLRIAADFENFRRRSLRDRQEWLEFGHQKLVKDLLPTVDNLERAIDHARQGGAGNAQGLLEGVELVLRELRAVLEKHGVRGVEAEGRPFDPSVHEAMAQAVDDSVPVNTVIQVFQPGYQLRDRLLRPARVVVSTPSGGSEPGDDRKSED